VSLPLAFLIASAFPTVACGCDECRAADVAAVNRPLTKRTLLTKAETEDFDVYSYDSSWPAAEVGKLAEDRRTAIYQHWRGKDVLNPWTPKCVLVLHSSRQSYLTEVGRGGERTLGSSLLDVQKGVCRSRRIDLLTDASNKITALSHELTHIVISDIFRGQRLPQWLDEGIAILADAHEKQLRHAEDWSQAKARGTAFSVGGLVGLETYPPPSQFPAFYGGSASLTALLARRGDSTRLLKFVEASIEVGYDKALRDVYQIEGLAELEQIWRQSEETAAYSLPQVAKQ
jgi:hypothetical protein